MITPYSYIANLRCAECDQLQPVFQMSRTNEARASILGPLEFFACRKCETKLRIADYNKMLHFLMILPVFLTSAILGAVVLSRIGLFGRGEYEGINFIGFVVIVTVFVMPAVLFCYRFLKVEIIE